MLALLASAATDGARTELSAAIGRPAESAQAEAIELIQIIDKAEAASAALGLWLDPEFTIRDKQWAAGLPAGVVGSIPGQAALDDWTRTHTRGLIDRFPLQLTADDKLVLATALAVKTRWRNLFQPGTLTWNSRRIDGLTRTTGDLDDIALLYGTTAVTRAVVVGVDDVDVHLLLGPPDADPADVLATGLGAVTGDVPTRSAAALPVGATADGLAMTSVPGARDTVQLSLPPFDIRSSHNLCVPPERFGLTSAMDPHGGQFPALHPLLYVGRGAQDVLATFSHEGFEAAATTAFGMFAAAALTRPTRQARRLAVTFDRPFGFLAIHRPTGLALVAGWITKN